MTPMPPIGLKGKGENKQTVSGYHANITETCTEGNEIDLIVDAQVVPANVTEDEFLIESINHSSEVLGCGNDESGQEKNKILDLRKFQDFGGRWSMCT